jgi:hypothetical protein
VSRFGSGEVLDYFDRWPYALEEGKISAVSMQQK